MEKEKKSEQSALKKAEKAVNASRPNDNLLRFDVSSKEVIDRSLAVTDLTADDAPPHIINIIFKKIKESLTDAGFGEIRIVRTSPIVSAEDNFDKLLFPADNAGRASTYTRYVDENNILRTHTSASVPQTFKDFYKEFNGDIPDTLFLFPGLVYRRDEIDPRHLDVFHQVDIWTLRKNGDRGPATREDLLRLVKRVVDAIVPGAEMIVLDAVHPYTLKGIEVYAKKGDMKLEVLEAGIGHPEVLRNAGFDPEKYSGLAAGFGLDRLVMLLKDIPDVRFLRSKEPRIAKQMLNTEKFKPVSSLPPISRDMSYTVPANYTIEDISEDIKTAFGDKAFLVENAELVSRTKYADLPEIARERLGAQPGQDNILMRITLRHPDITLTKKQANELYDLAYPKLHKGTGGYLS